MSVLATVGQVTALLQSAHGLVDAIRAPRAATPAPSTGQSFAAMLEEAAERFIALHDKDGTGKLSASEFPGSPRLFEILDADGDGHITQTELRTGFRHLAADKKAERLIARLDATGDGRLTPTELGLAPEQFAHIDANGDGIVDRDEMRAFLAQRSGAVA